MRTALLTGLIAGLGLAWLNFGHMASNADFVYMCAAAELLKRGILLATPYFPPGYPLLLWGIGHSGMTPLNIATLLSAFGAALSAGAVAYVGRLWRLPPVAALGLGLLGLSLPDVFQIACNPHLDALYTGIGAVLLAVAMRSFAGRAHFGLALVAMLCTLVLISFRYHAVLLVVPLAVVLICYKHTRLVGICTMFAAVGAIGYVYWALYVCTHSFSTAGMTQIATGATYRALGDAGALKIFNDYGSWLKSHPPVTFQMVLDGIRANWVFFLTRKAILLGAAVWLLAVLVCRRSAAGSLWLVPFIAGYTLAVSPTYFTPRASALTELCGLMLCAAGLGMLLFENWGATRAKRGHGASRGWLDPAVTGMVLCALLLAGIGYNAWRLYPLAQQWRRDYSIALAANQRALTAAGGKRLLLFGSMDRCGWPVTDNNLPGPVYSRWWMDDPAISPALNKLIPKYTPAAVAGGQTPVRAVLTWNEVDYQLERELVQRVVEQGSLWREIESGTPKARLFVRR
jgi:hypothetical protein